MLMSVVGWIMLVMELIAIFGVILVLVDLVKERMCK